MRVVIADDNLLVREGITRVLEDAGLEVVAGYGTAQDLLRELDGHAPDVVVIDIRMPPTHTDEGFRAAQEIRTSRPGTGVLVLSQYVELGLALQFLSDSAAGAGYLLKDRVSHGDDFAAAVRRVGEGGSAIDPSIVSQLLGRARVDGPLDQLTPKERDVLGLMAQGRTNQAIADQHGITLRSAEKHVSSIFAKLGLPATGDDHRRVLAVLLYLRS